MTFEDMLDLAGTVNYDESERGKARPEERAEIRAFITGLLEQQREACARTAFREHPQLPKCPDGDRPAAERLETQIRATPLIEF